MKDFLIRNAKLCDYKRVLDLNEESVEFLSPMDEDRLNLLASEANIFSVIELDGNIEGFILAFRENSDYDSINYKWFSDRYDKFLYIDRVVIAKDKQKEGLGTEIYNWIFNNAEVKKIAAEIDIKPANPISLKFHRDFGFKEVGQQSVAGGSKIVSLEISEI